MGPAIQLGIRRALSGAILLQGMMCADRRGYHHAPEHTHAETFAYPFCRTSSLSGAHVCTVVDKR